MSLTLHAEDLVKRFGGLEAVRDVRLAVAPGETVGLLGPNVTSRLARSNGTRN